MRDQILNLSDAKRVAVMGGTFDPIHYGHLVTAEAVRNEYNIDRVIFIPTGKPPHKPDYTVTHSEHRYLMTVLATYNNPAFEVSRIEIERQGLTYTIDTIRELRRLCAPDTKIYFITGADAVHQILNWKDSETLLNLCSFIAVTRPGYNSDKLYKQVVKIKTQFKSKIHFLEVPALAISSSDIRHRVAVDKPIKYLLPEEVAQYIAKFRLYAPETEPAEKACGMSRKSMERRLRKALTDKRYIHTQGVAEEAVKLAAHYGGDKEKALIAGLLHDCAKCLSGEEILRQSKEFGLELDDIMLARPIIAHGFLGAETARRDYQVNDPDILDAISFHTTGRADMSLLEKIIYVADYIEPNREAFLGLDDVRQLAYVDLDLALSLALQNTINENKAKNAAIHPLSYEALSFLKQREENETDA